MGILWIRNPDAVERSIISREKEMETALPYAKQYLEGQIYVLKQLQRQGIDLKKEI